MRRVFGHLQIGPCVPRRSPSACSEVCEKKKASLGAIAMRKWLAERTAQPRSSITTALTRVRIYFWKLSAHADGERRGLQGIEGQHRKGLDGAHLYLPSDRCSSSAFAIGMLRGIEKKTALSRVNHVPAVRAAPLEPRRAIAGRAQDSLFLFFFSLFCNENASEPCLERNGELRWVGMAPVGMAPWRC